MPKLSTILHVDDDFDIRDIVQMSLSMDDSLTLYQSSSGPEALDFLATTRPDLLLLDVMMPGMTGPELWAKIKALPEGYAEIPTIFMTAKAEDSLSKELLQQGAIAVITKPFDPMSLGPDIRSAWEKQ
ncbi:response regulator [Gymnodinialimonas ceratoperidinii]|uniref:Response regulator n=1 Tax=Gymnodinialimonas ceratoperidinii TaxID=2856823 RepID=A0A8F6TYM5_9RHOB|nr:response regulator [Gymnodinialimonas ceratoperidinii]QXT40858.1 response regulator [Gymnodinialimonas ceratoperidinii]